MKSSIRPLQLPHEQSDMLYFETFFQSRIRYGCIGKHRLVISIDVRWSFNWDAHHPQFVPQASDVFTALLHSHKFRAK